MFPGWGLTFQVFGCGKLLYACASVLEPFLSYLEVQMIAKLRTYYPEP